MDRFRNIHLDIYIVQKCFHYYWGLTFNRSIMESVFILYTA